MTRIHGDIRRQIVAAARHGVLGRAELLALGLTAARIDWLVKNGTLWPLHPGVYAVGRPEVTVRGRLLAAVLACGPGAVLSHRGAAFLLGYVKRLDPRVSVTVPRVGTQRARGLRIHITSTLQPEDVIEIDGIPCTAPERTLLDLADVCSQHDLDRAAEAAYLSQSLRTLVLHRHVNAPGRRTRKLRRALRAKPPRTRSRAEREFLRLVREAGLPEPLVNVWFPEHGFEVDVFWPELGLVVEIDSRLHDTPHARERDARKDRLLRQAGISVIRTRPPTFAETVAECERRFADTS